MEYINSFTEQFLTKYKKRRIPFMIAENEFGVKKFVCTSLRPTQIPIPELYDMYECASFLAGYVIYEPLDPQTEPPQSLFSPTRTLDSNTGDSFDLANLLCSFLLGNGYSAYIVCGYAPRFITLKDQSLTHCPMINESIESAKRKSSEEYFSSEANRESKDQEINSYVPPDNSEKNSKFLAEEAEKQRLASLDTFKLWIPDEDVDEKKVMEEERKRDEKDAQQRYHCWIYVAAGCREVKESLFIEPTTGRVYNAYNAPYIAIESVWNNVNYWVNTQLDKKISEIDMDFSENIQDKWEQLFLTKTKKSLEHKKFNNNSEEEHDLLDNTSEAEEESKINKKHDEDNFFDSPPTWVHALSITRSKYLLRFPPVGKKTVQYYCAKADFFSKRRNKQGIVMKITLYLDKKCTIIKEIHEWFDSRKDKMYKRVRFCIENKRFVEFYNPGSVGEVKKWTEYAGKKIEVDFFVNGRLDRLKKRVETIGENVVEYFEGRADLMVFRSVALTTDPIVAGARQFVLTGSTLSNELYITQMTLLFEKNKPQQNKSTQNNNTSNNKKKKKSTNVFFTCVKAKPYTYTTLLTNKSQATSRRSCIRGGRRYR